MLLKPDSDFFRYFSAPSGRPASLDAAAKPPAPGSSAAPAPAPAPSPAQ
jgi:hypothetical protein